MPIRKKPDLPEEYQPRALRSSKNIKREVCYAVGIEQKPNSYGMIAGPQPDLESMLEFIPDEEGLPVYLFRFNEDGTEDIIYRWQKDRWVRFNSR